MASEPIHLKAELLRHGCGADPDEFRDVIQELKAVMYPTWTDEDLLKNPRNAIQYAEAVRCRVGCAGLPDEVILGALQNIRKAGRREKSS